MRTVALAAAAAWCPHVLGAAPAAFPEKPLRFVVPYTPGGTVDILARAVGDGLAAVVRQPVVIDNRPGAGGTVAAAFVAKSPPDGYTVLVSDVGPLAIARSAYRNLSYDTLRDFAPVTIGTVSSLDLAVHPSLPVSSVKEFVAFAKARPGQLSYASSGIGGVMHMAGELFRMLAGVDLVHVPYKGGTIAITAMVSGEVPVSFSALPTTLPFAQAGRTRILAVTMDKRAKLAPNIATIAESGVPGYDVTVWQGFVVPAATPKDIVARLNTGIVEVLRKPDVASRLVSQGFDVVTSSPEEFATYIRAEVDKWARVVKSGNIVVD